MFVASIICIETDAVTGSVVVYLMMKIVQNNSGGCTGARIAVPPPMMRTTVPPLMRTSLQSATSLAQLVVYGGQQAPVPARPAAAGPTPLMAVQARPTASFNVPPPPAPRQFPRRCTYIKNTPKYFLHNFSKC